MSLSKHFSALLLLPLLAMPAGALADPLYTLTFLPGDFEAAALNRDGLVVGTAGGGAAIWSPASTTYLASLLPGGEGFAINSTGGVAGRFGTGGFVFAGGSITTFALPMSTGGTWATGLNDAGQVSGVARQSFGEHQGFLYAAGGFTDMGHFGGGLGFASAINASGQLAGFASLSNEQWWDPERHAAVFRGGELVDLGTLGGRSSEASDINDGGVVAGWSETADGASERPFLFAPGSAGMIDLGSLGGSVGRANGINNGGMVVGLSDIGGLDGYDYHAFIYGSGGMADLNGLVALEEGWILRTAIDVNDMGQILAQACNEGLAECRAVRLDLIAAVPEPGGWAMLAGGLVLVLWRARRRTLWIAAAPLLAAPLASAQALPHYMPTFLPAGFSAMAINGSGHVAGYNGSAALWNGSTLSDYAAVAPGSLALGLNNRGQLAGGWESDAYIFAPGGMRNVARHGLWDVGFAVAINDMGVVAGRGFWLGGERTRGFVLANGVMRMIPSFGGDWSEVAAINRSGQVAGTAATAEGPFVNPVVRAFIYKDKSMRELGTLGGSRSSATDINDAGQVVGYSAILEENEFGEQLFHPFLYTGGSMRDLGTLGGSYGSANGINNLGVIVGESDTDTPDGVETRAFFYAAGSMTDLNLLAAMPAGWLLTSARDINDAGQILARACNLEDCLPVRLDPVPAP